MLEIPPDWEIIESEWPGFTARRAEATLRVMDLTPLEPEPSTISTDRRRVVIEFNRSVGHSVVDVDYGSFAGHLIEVADADLWIRCWMLVSGATELEVAYACPRADAGRDGASLHQMLRTLTLTSDPPTRE